MNRKEKPGKNRKNNHMNLVFYANCLFNTIPDTTIEKKENGTSDTLTFRNSDTDTKIAYLSIKFSFTIRKLWISNMIEEVKSVALLDFNWNIGKY